jgi:hypothetical protein
MRIDGTSCRLRPLIEHDRRRPPCVLSRTYSASQRGEHDTATQRSNASNPSGSCSGRMAAFEWFPRLPRSSDWPSSLAFRNLSSVSMPKAAHGYRRPRSDSRSCVTVMRQELPTISAAHADGTANRRDNDLPRVTTRTGRTDLDDLVPHRPTGQVTRSVTLVTCSSPKIQLPGQVSHVPAAAAAVVVHPTVVECRVESAEDVGVTSQCAARVVGEVRRAPARGQGPVVCFLREAIG